MIKHIILWTLKSNLSDIQKETIKADIKTSLEGLMGIIPGLLEISVHIHGLNSSNADIMLDSSFTDANALQNYAVHPAHVAIADEKVRPFTAIRSCLDFEI